MVAAWMRADTGVGPSIASGNQTWSGTWADFPTAPQKIQSAAAVTRSGVAAVAAGSACPIPLKLIEPVSPQRIRIPAMKPKSPIRFVRKAFFEASAAEFFVNQWPMRR